MPLASAVSGCSKSSSSLMCPGEVEDGHGRFASKPRSVRPVMLTDILWSGIFALAFTGFIRVVKTGIGTWDVFSYAWAAVLCWLTMVSIIWIFVR